MRTIKGCIALLIRQRMGPVITPYTEDLCLVVTERCNLNCSYCQSDKSFRGMMSWNVAKQYIDEYLSVCKTSHPSFTLMGGEPFIAFNLIKHIVDYVLEKYSSKKANYTIVTNGTLVHNDIQHWILQHEHEVQVVLSLDGLGEVHNLNRCNSLKCIDLPFFRNLKKPIVNSVFTADTICHMAETTIAIHHDGFHVKGFIADGEHWTNESIPIIAEQLRELINYYLENTQIVPMSLLAQPLHYLTFSQSIHRCGTADFTEVSVSADGKLWACHRCSPFENHGSWRIPERLLSLEEARLLLPECKDCFLTRICNACPASNASIMENKDLSITICNIRKLLFKANAYFLLSMLASDKQYAGIRHLDVERRKHAISSAQIIIENL